MINLGLIPDGNRRYAANKSMDNYEGHYKGYLKFKKLLKWCVESKYIKSLTVYALSDDNLKRSEEEVKNLFSIYQNAMEEMLISNDKTLKSTRIRFFGNSYQWSKEMVLLADEIVKQTKHNRKFNLNILLAYNGRDHITDISDIDLVIRTGKQKRLSGFMLYESAYAEIWFSDTLFPALTKKEFTSILQWHKKQNRNYGK